MFWFTKASSLCYVGSLVNGGKGFGIFHAISLIKWQHVVVIAI